MVDVIAVSRRLGTDQTALVRAQRAAAFAWPLAALAAVPPPDDAVALRRHHSPDALRALLEDLEGAGAARSYS